MRVRIYICIYYILYTTISALPYGKYLYMRGAIPQNAKLCVSRPRNACHSSFITYICKGYVLKKPFSIILKNEYSCLRRN